MYSLGLYIYFKNISHVLHVRVPILRSHLFPVSIIRIKYGLKFMIFLKIIYFCAGGLGLEKNVLSRVIPLF